MGRESRVERNDLAKESSVMMKESVTRLLDSSV